MRLIFDLPAGRWRAGLSQFETGRPKQSKEVRGIAFDCRTLRVSRRHKARHPIGWARSLGYPPTEALLWSTLRMMRDSAAADTGLKATASRPLPPACADRIRSL